MYRQVSWLAALALPVRLPDAAQATGPKRYQWHCGGSSPLTVAGAASASDRERPSPCSLFSRWRLRTARNRYPLMSPVAADLVKPGLQSV
jgi:hypothetical protein